MASVAAVDIDVPRAKAVEGMEARPSGLKRYLLDEDEFLDHWPRATKRWILSVLRGPRTATSVLMLQAFGVVVVLGTIALLARYWPVGIHS